jgi:hypothetical protein
MKHFALFALVGLIAAAAPAATVFTADFTGSTAETTAPYDGTPTTAANLDNGTTGGSWSAVSTTSAVDNATVTVYNDAAGSKMTENYLLIGIYPSSAAGNDSTHVSTATLNLNTAATLAGATISMDVIRLGGGGQNGDIWLDLYDGTTQVLRLSYGNDGGTGRGTVNHWSAVGGTRTALTSEDLVWEGFVQEETVAWNLASSSFTVGTTDTDLVLSSALDYFSGVTSTTFDKIVFSAEKSKATWGIDNITVSEVPEPATMSLLALGGVAMLRRRKK